MSDPERALATVTRLSALGARISVDDFGAGQANLRHAWSILPRYLKLDRTLVSRLDSDDARRALVGSIVSYAEKVGASLIAEGVETHEQLAALVYMNCAHAQGFLFSRSVAATVVPTLVDGPLLGSADAETQPRAS